MTWKWFGVKTLYRSTATGRPSAKDAVYDSAGTLVEERVVVLRARSHDEAHRKAAVEAKEYAKSRHVNPYGQRVRTRLLTASDSFELYDTPGHLTEVWSTTYVLPSSVSDGQLITRAFGPYESPARLKRRKKYLNREFSGGVR